MANGTDPLGQKPWRTRREWEDRTTRAFSRLNSAAMARFTDFRRRA